ncbi:MAG: hypothetical protein ACREO5_02835, partial [Candidatus Binatia bacterium]
PVVTANAPAANAPANSTTDAAGGTETEAGQAEHAKTQNAPEKNSETKTKTAATSETRSEDTSVPDQPPDQPPDVSVGNVRVRNGRVETPNVVIDENGVVRRINGMPVMPGLPPGITREQLRQMTPDQRRQLRMIYRRNSQQHPIP